MDGKTSSIDWTYFVGRNWKISTKLETPAFSDGSTPLPDRFGTLLDERAVEYPWAFQRIAAAAPQKLLDVGPALNHEFCVEALQKDNPDRQITFFSLTPEANCFYERAVSYQLGDARSLPFQSDFFDVVSCISTLEHIGMDNRKYGGSEESDSDAFKLAIAEMRRVLKPGAPLLVTVPFGANASDPNGRHIGFTMPMIRACLQEFELSKSTASWFRYVDSAWRRADANQCENASYTSENLPNSLAYAGRSIRSEAVACLELIK
ncbi:MAG: class I SAM-dependent methyltransferase [Verrucomicrobiota bacterium]